jgi:murein DD-endopeptidase MepM/ murein hydrolase activator NlpD
VRARRAARLAPIVLVALGLGSAATVEPGTSGSAPPPVRASLTAAAVVDPLPPGPLPPGPLPPGPLPPGPLPPEPLPPEPLPPEPVPPAPTAPAGAGVPAPGARYAWPLLPAPAIAVPFRAPAHVYGPGHRGIDLVGTAGQPVLAARAGTVVFAGPVANRGVVSLHHDDGLRTTYEPVRPLVPAGAVVHAGDVIGRLEPGHAMCAPAVCLHWGVRRGRMEYLDPLVLLRSPRVRLLPVPAPWPLGQPAASSSSRPRRRPTRRVCS